MGVWLTCDRCYVAAPDVANRDGVELCSTCAKKGRKTKT